MSIAEKIKGTSTNLPQELTVTNISTKTQASTSESKIWI